MAISCAHPDACSRFKVVCLLSLYVKLHLFVAAVSAHDTSRTSTDSRSRSSRSPYVPPQKENYYTASERGFTKSSPRSSPEMNLKTLGQLRPDDKPVPASAYQSQFVSTKPRPENPGSQDAPADATSGLLTKHPAGKPKKAIFCYYGSSANSRPGLGKFWPEHIDPFLCTHVIFAFVDITEDGTGIKPNNWNDMGENGLYARTMKLKQKNPDLKILLAVGGWKIGSKPFLPVIETQDTWKTWVSNVIIYLRKLNFDGFDMDWEFPAFRGSGEEDRHKFTLFMKDLYEGFAEEAKSSGKEKLILTLATASSAFYSEKSYEQSEIHKYIDYMLLMTYNYHGSGWEGQTGHHSALLPHPLDPEGEQRELYILWSVKYWLNYGVPKEKLVVGLATYGLGWKLTDKSQTGVRAPAEGGNTKGKYTEESGILSHYEICENVINNGWKVKWIEEQKVPYAYGDGEWVGFDSPDSFYLKAAMIVKEGLAGAFVWSVEMDDFNGHCGGPKYPLLRTIYEVFTQSFSVSDLKSVHELKPMPASSRKSIPSGQAKAPSSSAAAKARPPTSHGHKDHDLQKAASSGESSHHSVPSGESTHHPVPSGESSHHSVPSGESSHHSVLSGESTHHPVPSGESSHHSAPSGESTHHSSPSGESTHHPVPSGESTHHSVPSGESTHHSAPSGESTHHPVPSGESTHHPVPSGESTHHSAPSGESTHHPVPSSESTHHPVPSGESTHHSSPSGESTHHSSPSGESTHHSMPSGESSHHSAPSSSEDNSESLSSASVDDQTDVDSVKETADDPSYSYDEPGDSILETIDCGSLGVGIHADPKSCNHFILCMPTSYKGLGSTRMTCPTGTLFDGHLKVCNHQHMVQCRH